MSQVPQSKRSQHLASSGIELKSDDTQLDVALWRESIESSVSSIISELADLKTYTNEIEPKIDTTNARLQSIDDLLSDKIVTIPTVHNNIHNGISFLASHNVGSLGSNAKTNIYLETTNPIHLIFDAAGSGAYDFEVFEAPTVTSGTGSVFSPFNKKRTSSNLSSVRDNASSPSSNSLSKNVTTTSDGVLIYSMSVGSGVLRGGSFYFEREIILKANTKYEFRLTSRSSSNRVHIGLDWYEPY